MKKIFILSLLSISYSILAHAQTCTKCEKIREYNKAHPENNYYWYDDYLDDQNKKDQPKDDSTKASKTVEQKS
ncbi:hypothetical protein BN1013_00485 [Candidatus Rubidus massiliensis]|nr:hypothetical protein BN1013_00485 [Candidatus Rubidus massiliensis]